LPRLQWNAQFILTYATFEHCLNRLCLLAEARIGGPVDFVSYKRKDDRRQGPFRARHYLEDIAQITAPFVGAEWQEVENLYELRNVLAHTNGEFSDPPTARESAVRAMLQTWRGVHVVLEPSGKAQRLRLTAEFLNTAIHALWTLLELVCREEPSAADPIHAAP
jgi:hypothetical protein